LNNAHQTQQKEFKL